MILEILMVNNMKHEQTRKFGTRYIHVKILKHDKTYTSRSYKQNTQTRKDEIFKNSQLLYLSKIVFKTQVAN